MKKTHINPKYFYNGISLIEHCRQTGLDYRVVCRIINTYRRRFKKEISVEEAVRRATNRKPTIKQQLLELNIPPEQFMFVYNRIIHGWDIDKAIKTPKMEKYCSKRRTECQTK
jgi:hypothetical protein